MQWSREMQCTGLPPKVFPGKTQIGPVMDTFVSKDLGLICIEILVPTEALTVDAAYVRVCRGVTKIARQTREFEPYIETMEVVSVKEGATVAPSQPENSRLGIGRPIAQPLQIPPPCNNRSLASQSDTLDMSIGERRWYSLVMCSFNKILTQLMFQVCNCFSACHLATLILVLNF